MAEYNNHSHSILIGLVVVVLLLLSNIYTTTVLAGRWRIHQYHPTDYHHHHHQEKEKKLEPKVQLAAPLITLRRVLDSLNAELIRAGEPARYVLVPLRNDDVHRRKEEPAAALNFKLEIRTRHYRTMGGFRTLGMPDFARRAEANRVNTRRPIFRFRSDPDWEQQQALGSVPESRGGGGTRLYTGIR